MLKDFIAAAETWNSSKSERQKLQHSYLVLAVITIFVAGLISLVNADFGHTVVLYGFAATVIFLVNGVVWNLVHSIILSKLSSKPRKK